MLRYKNQGRLELLFQLLLISKPTIDKIFLRGFHQDREQRSHLMRNAQVMKIAICQLGRSMDSLRRIFCLRAGTELKILGLEARNLQSTNPHPGCQIVSPGVHLL